MSLLDEFAPPGYADQPPTPPTPFQMVADLLRAADRDELPPDFSVDPLLQTLELDGDKPDGKSLHSRLTGGYNNPLTAMNMGTLMGALDQLVEKTNHHTASGSQERAVSALAQVIGRHVEREGFREGDNLCVQAVDTIGTSRRKDLVPDALKRTLGVEDYQTRDLSERDLRIKRVGKRLANRLLNRS
jgi:Arc/MetJ family transcription regulator